MGREMLVYVSGGHIYLAGMQESAPTYVLTATYWKDGNVTLLQRSEVTAYANSVFPSGNNVYTAGYENVAIICISMRCIGRIALKPGLQTGALAWQFDFHIY